MICAFLLLYRSVGLFCHCEEPGEIRLVHGCNVSMNTLDYPDAREFFEYISGHVLPTDNGGQFDAFVPLAASGRCFSWQCMFSHHSHVNFKVNALHSG